LPNRNLQPLWAVAKSISKSTTNKWHTPKLCKSFGLVSRSISVRAKNHQRHHHPKNNKNKLSIINLALLNCGLFLKDFPNNILAQYGVTNTNINTSEISKTYLKYYFLVNIFFKLSLRIGTYL